MKFHKSGLILLLRDFYTQHPARFFTVMLALLFAGLAGGIGLATFMPVIEVVVETDPSRRSSLAKMAVSVLDSLGIGATLGPLLLTIVLAIVLKGLLLLFAMLQTGYTTMRIITDLRMELVHNLLKARWDFFIERPLGSFANAVNAEAVRSSQAFFAAFLLVADIFQVMIYMALAMIISWNLTLAAVIASPVLFLAFHSLLGMARRSGQEQTEMEKTILAKVTDTLQGIKPIKAMGVQHRLEPIIEGQLISLLDTMKRQVLASQILKTQQESLIVLIICLGLYLLVTYGGVDMASMLGLVVLFYRSMSLFASLQKRHQLVAIHESAYRSLSGMIQQSYAASEEHMGEEKPNTAGPVAFRDVGLKYGENTVFSGVNLCLPTTGMVCLVGPSGAGKTSMADMIVGLVTPTSGRVTVGEQDLGSLDLQQWRRHIGYVPQEMILFNDSVRNNLTLRDDGISQESIWSALERAGLKDVVQSLPEGLDTQLGERGVKLSGGQRQRLATARALIRDPEILILDEVTASLDPVTEQTIAATLASVAKDRLVIAITHQTGLLQFADLVLRVDKSGVEKVPAVMTELV